GAPSKYTRWMPLTGKPAVVTTRLNPGLPAGTELGLRFVMTCADAAPAPASASSTTASQPARKLHIRSKRALPLNLCMCHPRGVRQFMMNLEASHYQAIGFSGTAFMFDCIRSRGRGVRENAPL